MEKCRNLEYIYYRSGPYWLDRKFDFISVILLV